jgi:hypothetical protein
VSTPEPKAAIVPEIKVEKPVAPERYVVKAPRALPQGQTLDEEVLSIFSNVANDQKLTSEQAQTLADKVMPAIMQRGLDQQRQLQEKWIKEIQTDTELGGAKLQETLANAKAVLDAAGTQGLRDLAAGPLGNNPDFIRLLTRFHPFVKEDRFVNGGRGGPVDLNDDAAVAGKLYGKSPKG